MVAKVTGKHMEIPTNLRAIMTRGLKLRFVYSVLCRELAVLTKMYNNDGEPLRRIGQVFLFTLLAFASEAARRPTLAALARAQAPRSTTTCQGKAKVYVITNSDVDSGRAVKIDGEIPEFIWRVAHP